MMRISIIAALVSYLVMLLAYFQPRRRQLHIPVMLAIIVFDLLLPFYLYAHGHWYRRLVDEMEFFSALVWMHFIVLASMYVLDGMQIISARKMLQGELDARAQHRSQGRALLFVRLFVILSGAMLAPWSSPVAG